MIRMIQAASDRLVSFAVPRAAAAACVCDWVPCGTPGYYRQACKGTGRPCGFGCKRLD